MNSKIRFQTTKQIDDETALIKTISDYKRLGFPTDTVQILYDGVLIARMIPANEVNHIGTRVWFVCNDQSKHLRVSSYISYYRNDHGIPHYLLPWPLPDNFSIDL